jgi:predicted nucleic acid-binding protein
MISRLLDTNILLRHLLGDHPTHSPAATQLIQQIEQGQVRAWTTALTFAEVVFVLTGRRTYNQPRPVIRANLLPLIELPNLKITHKRRYRRVFDLWLAQPRLSFVDAYQAALVEQSTPPELYSFDTDFDLVPSIKRIEPAAESGNSAT